MDPNTALTELRNAVKHALAQQKADTDASQFCVVDNRTVSAMVDHFEALDEWLSNGGFLPAPWER